MAENLQEKMNRLARGQYLNWQERRQHETGALTSPGEYIWLNPKKFEDYYPRDIIKKIIETSSHYKLDPNDLLAVGVAETGLGYRNPNNPMQIFLDVHEGELRKRYPQIAHLSSREMTTHPAFPRISIDYAGELLRDAFNKYPTNRLAALQRYSGRGSVLYGGRVGEKRFFGKPSTEIDFWKEKPQGRRVNEISWWLRANEELQKMINEFY